MESNDGCKIEKSITAKDELAALDKKRSELKKKVAEEKSHEKVKASVLREKRDKKNKATKEKLTAIQKEIYEWNKKGKAAKSEFGIISVIKSICGDEK